MTKTQFLSVWIAGIEKRKGTGREEKGVGNISGREGEEGGGSGGCFLQGSGVESTLLWFSFLENSNHRLYSTGSKVRVHTLSI